MNNAKMPNLELLEYKAMKYLECNDMYLRKKEEAKKNNTKNIFIDSIQFDVVMFPQWWGSSCGPFDIDKNKKPVVALNVMTKLQTTIFHELTTDMYVVFFGDHLGYIIHDASQFFLEDIRNQNLQSLSIVLKTDRY